MKAYLDGRTQMVDGERGPTPDPRTYSQLLRHPAADCTGEETYEAIQFAANAMAPMEACGFVLDTGLVVHCNNVDPAPYWRFLIDGQEAALWWATGRVVAVWHSHPEGPAVPSEPDEEQANPGVPFLVYSVEDEDLAEFVLVDGRLTLSRMMSPV